jgi:predicted permease
MEGIIQDFRFGLRQLRRNLGFSGVAILTLALGIGANTSIFSVVSTVFQQGLPAHEPDQILGLSFRQGSNLGQRNFSYPDFQDIRQQATSFYDLFAYRIGLDGLKTGDHAEQVVTSFVTGNYFTTLGLNPALGRLILPSEGAVSGSDPLLVLGYSYWRERFGGSPDIIGKQVEMDGHPLTVVGVAPKGFRGLYGAAIDVQGFMPINMFSIEQRNRGWADDRTSRSLYVMGRLRPGTSPDQAPAALSVVASRLAQQYPKDWRAASIETYPAEAANTLFNPSRHTYEIARLASALFLAMAGLVLLLACFNVANVLLVRATVRKHEMAIRAALGASRGRLIRQILSESIELAILGGAAGLALGVFASAALSSIHLRIGIPVHLDFSFDWRVFAFGLSCALAAGIVVGIVPAARALRAHLGEALHEGARGIASGHHYLRDMLVVSQLAGSVVLLVVAGLFARCFQKAAGIQLGFDPYHVLNLSMDPGQVGYDDERGREFYKDLLSRVRALPRVQAASLAFTFPGSEYSESERVYVEGHLPPPGQSGPTVYDNSVSPGYFDAMRIPLIEGRGFRATDTQSAPRVAVINQTMAREFWPREDPLGKRFKLSSNSDTWIQIAGVARDSRVQDLTADVSAYFYLPLDQDYSQLVTLQVRTIDPPEDMIQEIEHQIHMLEPGLPVFGVQTMEQALNGPGGFLHYWLGSVLAGVLGLLGLVLTVVGVYGVISYSASERTHEMGIRMALGAEKAPYLR